MQAMEISRTGLDVEWKRLEVIADNLANLNSVQNGTNPLYRERHLVSGPRESFASRMDAGSSNSIETQSLTGVDIYGISQSDAPPRMVHEPGNPAADEKGMVAYPNVDHAEQMLEMVKTSRAYEANVVAMNSAREMYMRALNIGRRS
jgi:flagellar basal-body rod protein FlgC